MPNQTYIPVEKDSLLSRVSEMKGRGFTLSQITVTAKERFDVLYVFEKDLELTALRLSVGADEEVDSVSCIFPHVFLYENEMKDLFGVKVRNINLDFGGTLYKTAAKTPFAPLPVEKIETVKTSEEVKP